MLPVFSMNVPKLQVQVDYEHVQCQSQFSNHASLSKFGDVYMGPARNIKMFTGTLALGPAPASIVQTRHSPQSFFQMQSKLFAPVCIRKKIFRT